jgi:putative ABC transport system ATP-binding protein
VHSGHDHRRVRQQDRAGAPENLGVGDAEHAAEVLVLGFIERDQGVALRLEDRRVGGQRLTLAVVDVADVDRDPRVGRRSGVSAAGRPETAGTPASCTEPRVAGEDISRLRPDGRTAYRRGRIGFVFQFFNLIPTLTALENVQLIAELTGADAEARSRRILADVGLAGEADRFPGQLSGGEQQRVAIARAVVKEPPLLLCDEPTGSLDLVTGRQVLAVLRALAREGHHSVILVTHNSAIARMADRVVRMRSGEIVEERSIDHPVEAGELDW